MSNLIEQLLEMSRIADKHQEELNEIREKLKKINNAINEAKKELVAIDGNLVYGETSDRICHVIDILEVDDKIVKENKELKEQIKYLESQE